MFDPEIVTKLIFWQCVNVIEWDNEVVAIHQNIFNVETIPEGLLTLCQLL